MKPSFGSSHTGIAPNILLKHVENTAPFIFKGELKTDTKKTAFLETLRKYKKNSKLLKSLSLSDYFEMCLCAHWSTAGTFVPTDVDNQIREKLWKHSSILKHIDRMAKVTMDAWKWDYSQVTNRKSYNRLNANVMSTHEGTWLSVAIGAYCALVQNSKTELANEMSEIILSEIKKEEQILIQLREDRDHINFLRAAPLMAHNFGDLDRVMICWNMDGSDPFFKRIFKLGHQLNENYDPILVYTGKVNKEFSSKENHRHMAMRNPKCLRRSSDFLIPVGPFMDDWGKTLGQTDKLSIIEKGEVVAALFDGFNREPQAFGYVRAYRSLMDQLENGFSTLEQAIPYDLMNNINKSEFSKLANVSREEFEAGYVKMLDEFVCPATKMKF